VSEINVTLPWPPSINHYWRMWQNRMVISEAGRKYRSSVAEQILIQRGAKHFANKIKVTIAAYRPDERKRDLDNLLKSTLDALCHAGVYVDDSLIVDLRIYWEPEKAGMLKVKIEELE
jgi:crossover junction endodeoxyribonuclease RusA